MEMHQLRYVVAVARAGNFSRAAEQCHVSQPSLSQQILKLEDELGERLFDRTRREARLTPAGETFARRARRILEEVEAAGREAAEARGLLRGAVRLGVLPTIAPYLLPGPMAAFARRFPGVEVMVHEDTTAQLLGMLAACELDVAVVSEPLEDGRLERRLLLREELLVALPPKHPLAGARAIRAADLERERLIVMREGHCLGDQVLSFCGRRRIRASVSLRSAQLETVRALVAAGLGVSLVPAMAVGGERSGRGPVYRSLEGVRPEREVVAVWLAGREPGRAVRALLSEFPGG